MQVYKAAKYIRLSYTDDKSNESNSVGNQRKLIEDFVSRHPEIELVSEKVDDGYSGVIFDRPAFKEMMDDIMEGKINCVIVKDLSRLGREYIETGRYMRRVFPAYGVRFIAINDNIDSPRSMMGVSTKHTRRAGEPVVKKQKRIRKSANPAIASTGDCLNRNALIRLCVMPKGDKFQS